MRRLRHKPLGVRKPKIIPAGENWCSAGHLAPVAAFTRNKSTKSGYARYCREHHNLVSRRSYHVRTKPMLSNLSPAERAKRLKGYIRSEQVHRRVLNFGSNRKRWLLYRQGLLDAAKALRARKQYAAARVLALHCRACLTDAQDVSPRIVELEYPYEWNEVSRALRPQGSKPVPGSHEAKLYALYQWMLRSYGIKGDI